MTKKKTYKLLYFRRFFHILSSSLLHTFTARLWFCDLKQGLMWFKQSVSVSQRAPKFLCWKCWDFSSLQKQKEISSLITFKAHSDVAPNWFHQNFVLFCFNLCFIDVGSGPEWITQLCCSTLLFIISVSFKGANYSDYTAVSSKCQWGASGQYRCVFTHFTSVDWCENKSPLTDTDGNSFLWPTDPSCFTAASLLLLKGNSCQLWCPLPVPPADGRGRGKWCRVIYFVAECDF